MHIPHPRMSNQWFRLQAKITLKNMRNYLCISCVIVISVGSLIDSYVKRIEHLIRMRIPHPHIKTYGLDFKPKQQYKNEKGLCPQHFHYIFHNKS